MMRLQFKKMFFRKNSLLLSWMLSYISILFVPVVISGIIYVQTGNIVQNEINRANKALLTQVQQVMDNQLSDIEKLSMQVAFNDRVRSFLYAGKPLNDFQRYMTNQIIRDFKSYKTANGFIGDFYVYFKNSDTCLTPDTIASPELLYEMIHEPFNLTYAQWLNLMQSRHIKEYMLFDGKVANNTASKTIAFTQSLPIESHSDSLATIVIMLDETRFLETIENLKWINQGMVFIIDRNDRILASAQNSNEIVPVKYERLSGSSDIFPENLSGEDMIVSHILSQVTDWKYVSVLPERIFKEKVNFVQNLAAFSIIISILLGISVSFFFSSRNYIPIKDLVQAISAKVGISPNKECSEYQFIRDAVKAAVDEKEKINKKLWKQNQELRSNILTKLMMGRLENSLKVFDTFSSFDINLKSDYFAVMLIYIEDYGDILTSPSTGETVTLTEFVIRSVVEELAGQQHQGFMVEINEMMACLINFDGTKLNDTEEVIPVWKDELMRIATEAQQFIHDKFHVVFSVSISDVQKSVENIPNAYQEALTAMEYKMVMGIGKIIRIGDIGESDTYYDYPLEMEQQMINYCKAGDFDKAKDILNEVFSRNFSSESVSIQAAKCILFDLVSTLMKAINEITMNAHNSFIEEIKPIDRLLECETVMDMKFNMMEMLKQVCEYIENKKKSHNYELRDNIIRFINNNYQDKNISISMIAEKFGMNSTYISRFFKEQTGEALLDYINKVRLEKAKELLRAKKMNINETAVMVGYSNSNTFIRTFKKYEGLTPGQFKETSLCAGRDGPRFGC